MEHTPPDNLADWKNMQRRSARDLSDRRAVPCIAHADLACCIRLDVREQIEKSSVQKGTLANTYSYNHHLLILVIDLRLPNIN